MVCYHQYTELINYSQLLMNLWEFCFKKCALAVLLVQKHRLYKTFQPLFYYTVNQLLIHLVAFSAAFVYQSCRRVHIAPKKDLYRHSEINVTLKMYATQVFFQQWEGARSGEYGGATTFSRSRRHNSGGVGKRVIMQQKNSTSHLFSASCNSVVHRHNMRL